MAFGRVYFMRLDHDAAKKEHGRGMDPAGYSYLTCQPMGGKARNGGQRLGEMEVWGLEAHNAAGVLQELLTLKSDNPEGRWPLFQDVLPACCPTGETEDPKPALPEALFTLTAFLAVLGMKLELSCTGENGKASSICLLDEDSPPETIDPDAVTGVRLRPVTAEDKGLWSRGEVTVANCNRNNPTSLMSQAVFGPTECYT